MSNPPNRALHRPLHRALHRALLHSLPALLLATASVAQVAAPPDAAAAARMLRFPHVQGDKIAFVHGGDIWTASARGGVARRLTSWDDGFEVFPRISPDGTRVAFSGEYGGTRQVFVVPYEGGTPRQLTFYPDVGSLPPRGGYDNIVLDWTPDGSAILVRMNRTPYGERVGRYYLVDADGRGLERPLQIPEGGPASLSPDGTKLTYDIISREWRTWKRYAGGRAQDVWIYDLRGDAIEKITDWRGTDNWPMWLGDSIYFASDRAHGTLNLFAYDTRTKSTRQITDFRDYDVLFPSRGDSGVIFERGGELWIMDAGTERVRKLEITLADDRPWTRPVWKRAQDGRIAAFSPSPSGQRAVVEFRGDVFTVPREHGDARNLTATPDRREMSPRWSPDGASVAFLAECGADYELCVLSLAHGQQTRITDGTGSWILGFEWLPDSDGFVFVDKQNRLVRVDRRSRRTTELDRSPEGPIRSLDVSRDGGWLCYVKPGRNGHGSVWLCPTDAAGPVQVTSDDWDDAAPTFDPNGDLLYFASARDYRHDGYEFDERIYALLLRADVASPTAPRSDEEKGTAIAVAATATAAKTAKTTKTSNARADSAGAAAGKTDGDDALEIELAGLDQRIVVLPTGGPGSYGRLRGVDDGVLFVRDGKLELYHRADRAVKTVLEGAGAFELTPDRAQILFRKGPGLSFAKLAPGAKGNAVPLDGVAVRVTPQVEWSQMYRDAWRIMRDWFYDPSMHGVDWVAMRDKHARLLPWVAHRSDLDFLLGELVGELNAGHTYVQPGESPRVPRTEAGALGCELAADPERGLYRIGTVFDGENWNESTRNPLREPGVDVEEGDWLLAIDGHPLTADDNPYRFLEGKIGRAVKLLVHDEPARFGAREVVVRPRGNEQPLRYLTWVNNNRRIVDELSGGRIGYVHAPNTSTPGHKELFEGWRAQARVKDAMIIDDRYNGGGFIPADMAFEIGKPVLNYWSRRHVELSTTPQYAFEGPRVMLINGYSSSGGDAFPYYFKKLGLGTLMGKTTWGGLIGVSGGPRLVDGGSVSVPAFAFVDTDGEWAVEGTGVAPDVEVFDDPTLIAKGREPMLEAAVQHLLAELERSPKPTRPPTPRGPLRDRVLDPGSTSSNGR